MDELIKDRLFIRLFVVASILGMATGCVETRLKIPPPSGAVRAEFGTMGVFPVQFKSGRESLSELGTEIAGSKGQGAIEGVKAMFEPAGKLCVQASSAGGLGGFICIASMGATILAAPIAAIIGATRTRSAPEVRAAEQALLGRFNRINPREALRDQIVLAAGSKAGFSILAIDEDRQDAVWSGSTDLGSTMTVYFEPLLLFDGDKINPGVTLELKVIASIARNKDGAPLHAQMWRYWSEAEKFFTLAEDDAKNLDAMLAKGYERLAQKIVHDVFIASAPEPQDASQPETAWAEETSTFYYDIVTMVPPERQGAQ